MSVVSKYSHNKKVGFAPDVQEKSNSVPASASPERLSKKKHLRVEKGSAKVVEESQEFVNSEVGGLTQKPVCKPISKRCRQERPKLGVIPDPKNDTTIVEEPFQPRQPSFDNVDDEVCVVGGDRDSFDDGPSEVKQSSNITEGGSNASSSAQAKANRYGDEGSDAEDGAGTEYSDVLSTRNVSTILEGETRTSELAMPLATFGAIPTSSASLGPAPTRSPMVSPRIGNSSAMSSSSSNTTPQKDLLNGTAESSLARKDNRMYHSMPTMPSSTHKALKLLQPHFGLHITTPLGSGADGKVYKAINLETNIAFAVKEMPRTTKNKKMSDDQVTALRHQINSLRQLPVHMNVVHHYASMATVGDIYVKMQYIRGRSISRIISEGGAFDEATVRYFAKQLCDGLVFLQDNGVIHRDIKGANIIIDDDGVAKIADFGCSIIAEKKPHVEGVLKHSHMMMAHTEEKVPARPATADFAGSISGGAVPSSRIGGIRPISGSPANETLNGANNTSTEAGGSGLLLNATSASTNSSCARRVHPADVNQIAGTPLWMAPEVMDFEAPIISSKCDVWSFACTVVEMATGKAPWYGFKATDPWPTIFRISQCGHGPQLPPKLSRQGHDFLEKCFNIDPEQRMSAAECLKHPFLATKFDPDSTDEQMRPPTPLGHSVNKEGDHTQISNGLTSELDNETKLSAIELSTFNKRNTDSVSNQSLQPYDNDMGDAEDWFVPDDADYSTDDVGNSAASWPPLIRKDSTGDSFGPEGPALPQTVESIVASLKEKMAVEDAEDELLFNRLGGGTDGTESLEGGMAPSVVSSRMAPPTWGNTPVHSAGQSLMSSLYSTGTSSLMPSREPSMVSSDLFTSADVTDVPDLSPNGLSSRNSNLNATNTSQSQASLVHSLRRSIVPFLPSNELKANNMVVGVPMSSYFIPESVFFSILSYLTPKDIGRMTAVSRGLHSLVDNSYRTDTLWAQLFESYFGEVDVIRKRLRNNWKQYFKISALARKEFQKVFNSVVNGQLLLSPTQSATDNHTPTLLPPPHKVFSIHRQLAASPKVFEGVTADGKPVLMKVERWPKPVSSMGLRALRMHLLATTQTPLKGPSVGSASTSGGASPSLAASPSGKRPIVPYLLEKNITSPASRPGSHRGYVSLTPTKNSAATPNAARTGSGLGFHFVSTPTQSERQHNQHHDMMASPHQPTSGKGGKPTDPTKPPLPQKALAVSGSQTPKAPVANHQRSSSTLSDQGYLPFAGAIGSPNSIVATGHLNSSVTAPSINSGRSPGTSQVGGASAGSLLPLVGLPAQRSSVGGGAPPSYNSASPMMLNITAQHSPAHDAKGKHQHQQARTPSPSYTSSFTRPTAIERERVDSTSISVSGDGRSISGTYSAPPPTNKHQSPTPGNKHKDVMLKKPSHFLQPLPTLQSHSAQLHNGVVKDRIARLEKIANEKKEKGGGRPARNLGAKVQKASQSTPISGAGTARDDEVFTPKRPTLPPVTDRSPSLQSPDGATRPNYAFPLRTPLRSNAKAGQPVRSHAPQGVSAVNYHINNNPSSSPHAQLQGPDSTHAPSLAVAISSPSAAAPSPVLRINNGRSPSSSNADVIANTKTPKNSHHSQGWGEKKGPKTPTPPPPTSGRSSLGLLPSTSTMIPSPVSDSDVALPGAVVMPPSTIVPKLGSPLRPLSGSHMSANGAVTTMPGTPQPTGGSPNHAAANSSLSATPTPYHKGYSTPTLMPSGSGVLDGPIAIPRSPKQSKTSGCSPSGVSVPAKVTEDASAVSFLAAPALPPTTSTTTSSSRPDRSLVLHQQKLLKHLEYFNASHVPRVLALVECEEQRANLFVTSALGPSIFELLHFCGNQFSLQTVCRLGLRMVQAVEEIHERDVVHGNLTPRNIVMGKGPTSGEVYFVDFSQGHFYRNPKTHSRNGTVTTTNAASQARNNEFLWFCSKYVQERCTPAPRDDLISIIYVLCYLLHGSLPWITEKPISRAEMLTLKAKFVCQQNTNTPKGVQQFLKAAYVLHQQDMPDYGAFKSLLRSTLKAKDLREDGSYDWSQWAAYF